MNDLHLNTAELLYGGDLQVGDWIELGPYSLNEAEILEFGRRWDPLPIHTDPVAAAASPFGSLIASGVHTMAIYSSLVSPEFRARLALLAGKGIDRMRLPNPVRADSVLSLRVHVTEIRPGDRHADVHTHAVMSDQHGKVVLDLTSVLVLHLRSDDEGSDPQM
jgi:acyl dehydratase